MDERQIIDKLQEMAEQSLSPDVFEKWECVKKWLVRNRGFFKGEDPYVKIRSEANEMVARDGYQVETGQSILNLISEAEDLKNEIDSR